MDAEGCYRISIIKNKNSKGKALPLSVRLYFQIGLHRKDEAILKLIRSELGVFPRSEGNVARDHVGQICRLLSYLGGRTQTRSFSTDCGNSNKPAVVYINADTQEIQIILENKARSGVYR